MGDGERLGQVLSNLVGNAYESVAAMPAGTATIRVSARIERPAAELPRDFLVVEVEDNGPGIPEEIRDRIFEPYHTTKPRGTGLGLSICERIVTAHGGRIFFESAPGRTVFTMEVPLK